jgi:hypothetical protein
MPCWSTPSLRRRSSRLQEDGLSFSQWMELLTDQCAEIGITPAWLASVSGLGIPGLSGLDFARTSSADVYDAITGAPSATLSGLFDRRAEIMSELHETAHAIRALPPGSAIRMEQMAIGAGGSQAGMTWPPAYESELDKAILRMVRR